MLPSNEMPASHVVGVATHRRRHCLTVNPGCMHRASTTWLEGVALMEQTRTFVTVRIDIVQDEEEPTDPHRDIRD